MNAIEPVMCPRCGDTAGVPIVYGLPSRELSERAARGEVELGGCVIMPGAPQLRCRVCRHEWRVEPNTG